MKKIMADRLPYIDLLRPTMSKYREYRLEKSIQPRVVNMVPGSSGIIFVLRLGSRIYMARITTTNTAMAMYILRSVTVFRISDDILKVLNNQLFSLPPNSISAIAAIDRARKMMEYKTPSSL